MGSRMHLLTLRLQLHAALYRCCLLICCAASNGPDRAESAKDLEIVVVEIDSGKVSAINRKPIWGRKISYQVVDKPFVWAQWDSDSYMLFKLNRVYAEIQWFSRLHADLNPSIV